RTALGLCCIFTIIGASLGNKIQLQAPNGDPVASYKAALYWNTGRVVIDPPIRAVFHHQDHDKVDANETSSPTGVYFDFDISAFDCNGPKLQRQSARVPVMLRLTEWETPKFSHPSYAATVAQNSPIGTEVLRVAASEQHGSASVCRYEIENDPLAVASSGADGGPPAAVPFDIDGHDVPKQLVYPAMSGVKLFAPSAALSLTGGDKGQCVQNSAVVKISVQSSAWDQVCERSVRNLYEQRSVCQVNPASVDLLNPHYSPAKLSSTDSGKAEAEITLPDCKCCKAADIAAAQLKKKLLKDQKKAEKKKPLQPKEHHSFDGIQYFMDVPSDVVPKSHMLGQQFTLHFWLRHGPMSRDGAKEQILCSADERGHNRHHYSVFLHNCKLILLLRQEYNPHSDDRGLKAAEWRFRLSEVCDSEWHHYAVSFSGGRVKLDIDGNIFAATADNPQILDDYPMHRSPYTATRLTIGACWHSRDGVYHQFFKGSLAGLVLLRNNLESDTVIHCLNHCHEKLDFSTKTQLEPGMSVSLNADYTMIEIKGRNATELANLFRSIGYINVRRRQDELSSAVKRSIRLDTVVTCSNPKTTVTVDPVTINVEVSDPTPPPPPPSAQTSLASVLLSDRLCISGPNLLRYKPEELSSIRGGVSFLQGLEISLSSSVAKQLDACVLKTSPDFTAVESLIWPVGKATDSGIEGRVNQRQLLLEGYASARVYQSLLSRVIYSNNNPIIRYRNFYLTCSVRGGDVVSNDFTVKLPDPTPVAMPLPSGLKSDEADVLSSSGLSSDSGLNNENDVGRHHLAESHAVKADKTLLLHHQQSRQEDLLDNGSVSTPVAPILIGLATAGLVILALGLMYLRYRRSAQSVGLSGGRGGGGSNGKTLPVDAESQAEMEWDNSALNITVNPLDNEENMSDSGSEDNQEDDYVEDELNLDNGSSCSDEMEDDIDGMTASGLLMQRSAQIASSEDELDDESVVVQMVTGAEAVRYGQQQVQQPVVLKPQLEWDDSSLPDIKPMIRSTAGTI
uniref:SRCR domain-containing protein n=1 Tax=Macrostomum lignano TaxID=282301 RepID=A0A1I8J1G0_9PLAT